MAVKIDRGEYELIVSFKNQLNEKIDQFREKIKNLKQLNVLQEEIKKLLLIFNDFENKISTQKALIDTLEGRVCALRKVLVERNLKN